MLKHGAGPSTSERDPVAPAMAPVAEPSTLPEAPLDYSLSLRGLTFGNRAALLDSGAAAFPAMLEAIAEARSEVLLESYILADDATGRAFLDAAREAARRGCRVCVLVDGVGSLRLPDARLEAVDAAGGRAFVYRPVAPWRDRSGLWLRDHRKILVVDEQVGFVGGLNLADNYDERRGGAPWHDLHLRLEGPAAGSLRRLFATTWNELCERDEEKLLLAVPTDEQLAAQGPRAGGLPVQVIGNTSFGHHGYLRRAFLYAVKRARRTVYIENAYFIPDILVARALRRAARRGVDVRVIIPARSDSLPCDLASRAALPRLLRSGVRVAEWAPGMMHAKAAAVDGRWATVGSYNLDHRSLRYNLEVTANLLDAGLAGELEARIRRDFEASAEIDLATLARRPLLLRLLEGLVYRLRWLL